ncbi:MAG: N,N-dimethylformamidase beta subunit family domain-containing protein, partial [Betaproteobacteria bacterium]
MATETAAFAAAGPCNPIACENALAGSPPAEWQLVEPGDAAVQGFATDQSVNVGQTISFKVRATTPYHIDIYRVGWYQGNGARKVTAVLNIPLQIQPACRVDTTNTTGLIDCGNWLESASWALPATATTGVYFARLVRNDTNKGAGYMFFNVRNDASKADIVYQTSDTQRAAYNNFGGNNLYSCTVNCPPGNPQLYKGAYKVSFNRPNIAVNLGMQYSFFGAEFEMVEFLEANGYDISYISAVDTDRSGALLKNHKIFISSGHDEYWSGPQRVNVEAARDAGVNLAFFSGNEVFWKTRYENSIDGNNVGHRTMVTYKETHFNAIVDPAAPVWTGLWRDRRFSPPSDGGRPENALTGTIYTVDPVANFAILVPDEDGKMRFWRNTTVATQSAGQTATLAPNSLGYEWDEDLDNGARPNGSVRLSSTTKSVPNHLIDPDVGNHYDAGVATHHMTLYRTASGALVFGAGTVQWAWGLEGSPDGTSPVDVRMQQATVNLFADMGVQPTTLIAGIVPATKSTDGTPPTSQITSPSNGTSVAANTLVNIIGTATDSGGGVVGGVEVSTDDGLSWHPVSSGRSNWMYQWQTPQPGTYKLMARAADDSANLGAASAAVSVTVGSRACPCSIWPTNAVPTVTTDADDKSIEVGVKFFADSDGTISAIRFFKSATNAGTHVGTLWTANGQLLGQATFSGESATGWQQANLATPVRITAGTHYVVSYHASVGHYSDDTYYFADSSFDNPPLHALKDGADGANGVYIYSVGSAFPNKAFQSSNYWVDVVFSPSSADTVPPTVTSRTPVPSQTQVATKPAVTAKFSEPVQPPSVAFVLKSTSNVTVPATLSYD